MKRNTHPLAAMYRTVVATRNLLGLVIKLAWAAVCLWLARFPFRLALFLWDPHVNLNAMRSTAAAISIFVGGDLSLMLKIAAGLSMLAAIALAYHGINTVVEALPSITPRRINTAPGRARLATRDELRRSNVF
jgi:hypothetical protein